MTQAGVADALAEARGPDLGHSTVAKIERGTRGVGLGEAEMIAEILGTTASAMLAADVRTARAAVEMARAERELAEATEAARAAQARRDEVLERLSADLGADPLDLTKPLPEWVRHDRTDGST